MDTNNTPNMNTNMQSSMHMGPKKSKGNRVLVGVLIALLVLAAGAAGGYFWGQYQKDMAVEQAKKDAQSAAQQEINKAHEEANKQKTAPEKTVTETTCNADELSLELSAADAAAGTYAYDLTFTNMSDRTCTLYGYPGVSLVNDNGNMIGSPAERTENSEELTMTLAPEDKVKAVVYASNSNNFSDGQCKEGATKLRVYPPNDTGYLSIATQDTFLNVWCPGFEVSPVMGV
jgi:flagellar basal body-associated protein FliL